MSIRLVSVCVILLACTGCAGSFSKYCHGPDVSEATFRREEFDCKALGTQVGQGGLLTNAYYTGQCMESRGYFKCP